MRLDNPLSVSALFSPLPALFCFLGYAIRVKTALTLIPIRFSPSYCTVAFLFLYHLGLLELESISSEWSDSASPELGQMNADPEL